MRWTSCLAGNLSTLILCSSLPRHSMYTASFTSLRASSKQKGLRQQQVWRHTLLTCATMGSCRIHRGMERLSQAGIFAVCWERFASGAKQLTWVWVPCRAVRTVGQVEEELSQAQHRLPAGGQATTHNNATWHGTQKPLMLSSSMPPMIRQPCLAAASS